jgi:hypothetical protein
MPINKEITVYRRPNTGNWLLMLFEQNGHRQLYFEGVKMESHSNEVMIMKHINSSPNGCGCSSYTYGYVFGEPLFR